MARAPTDLRSLARSYTGLAIQTLAGIAQNGENESARVVAANSLLDRGWGKAPAVIAGDENGGALQVIIRHIVENAQQRPGAIEHQGELIDVSPGAT